MAKKKDDQLLLDATILQQTYKKNTKLDRDSFISIILKNQQKMIVNLKKTTESTTEEVMIVELIFKK